MAKPKYRLEALLRIKARMKKRAEMALARAIVELRKAKEKLEKLKEEKKKIVERWHEARKEMRRDMAGGIAVKKSNVHVNFMRKLKEDEEAKEEEIEDQKAVVEDCEAQVAKARREYIDAAKQLQIMEKHRELWQKKVDDEITRKEEREMDELSTTIHQLKRWRGEKSVFET
ncbi:MAG: flagellar FliJ family protein [Proteobacteria bacterium]|nr:flagellar FliJ family protein [Pseudomonadota bacterium]